MASRFLRASGNWNGPVWAATSGGAAGSAATPTASDDVYIDDNFTVTLISNQNCAYLYAWNGRVNLGAYTLTVNQVDSTGSSTTIDLGSGELVIDGSSYNNILFTTYSPQPTIIGGSSLVRFKVYTDSQWASLGSFTFNDVQIELYEDSDFKLYGSPTFRSLIIQSKNSAAHTVNISGRIKTEKFVALGSSSSNKLIINGDGYVPGGVAPFELINSGTSYGQNLDLRSVFISNSPNSKPYAGSNSVADVFSNGWLLQNPPISSTLITEFNSLSGWQTQAVGSGYVNVSGSTLNMGWGGGSAYTRITSTDSYDLVNDTFYMKVNSSTGGLFMSIVPVAIQGEAATLQGTQILASGERYWRINSTASGDTATLTMGWFDNGNWVDTYTKTVPTSQLRSVRFEISGTRNMNSASLVVDSVGVGPYPTQPIADFSATPTTGKRPVTVNFTDLTKGIPDTWSWSFGDGYTSTQQNPSHPYSKAGTYTVSLTASNSVGTDTVTKTGLVVIEPEIFTRSIGGTIKMGGGVTSRIVTFMRSIGGTIVMGGGVRAVLVRDAEALQSKTFLYKVYDPDGNFVEAWRDVISEPSFTHEINSAGSTMTVELARNSDSLGQVVSPLLTEDGQPIQTEDGQTLLATTTTRNQIGDDSSVNYNNRVDIVVFYGVVEPLYTEDMQVILTEDGEPLLAGLGAPNGRRIFTGFISEINSRYGNSETTIVQLTSYGWDLDQYPITTSEGATTVPFLSKDPSQIVKDAMDKFRLDSSVPGETNHSTNPSFETGSGTVEVRRNYFTNPALTGTGTLANGLALYTWQGGTGNTSLSAGVQTVTATGLTTLSRRYGVYVYPGVTASQGQLWTVSFDVNTISVPSGVTLRCFIVFSGPGNEYHEEITSVGRYSQTATAPAGTTGVSLYVHLQAAAPWTGTASFSFSKVMFEQTGAALPYFDGSTNDGFDTASLTPAWTGTPNNSASVLNGVMPDKYRSYHDNQLNTPVWLSSDSPNNGLRFARMLIVSNTSAQLTPADTDGIPSGVLRTGLFYMRSSRAISTQPRWREASGFGSVENAGGAESIPANEWTEVRRTGSPAFVNATLQFLTSTGLQPGDIIDIDNHMMVKGNYTGGYFDGNSQNAQWNGAPNASTSSLLKSQTYTTRNEASISNTGTSVSYTFRANTYKEVLDKSLELMPSNWYYRIGLGDNVVYFRERPTTPQHLFYLGKHIKALDLRGSILDVVNHTLFTGGGEPALYLQRKEAPAPRVRRGLEVKSDSRVTVPLSAQIISDGIIENGNKVQYRTTVEILSGQYDIESIQPGDLVGFRNFGVPEIDTLELIVVGVNYSPDILQLALERKPPTVSKRLEDIKRQLKVSESQNIPGSPS